MCILPLLELVKHQPIPLKFKKIQGQAGIAFQVNPPAGILFADRDTKPKTEVSWGRAPKRNMELLLTNGIVIENNVDDWVVIQLPRLKKCPENAKLVGTSCLFRIYGYEINYEILNHALELLGETPQTTILDYNEYFGKLENNREKIISYKAILKYRNAVVSSPEACTVPFRTVRRKLNDKEESSRLRLVDKLCLSHHETIHSHEKLIGRLALNSLIKELNL